MEVPEKHSGGTASAGAAPRRLLEAAQLPAK
jgi:hypothetical protein